MIATHGIMQSKGDPSVLMLAGDYLLGADPVRAAYSLRIVRTGYTGNVIEVRRSSDDTLSSFTAEQITDGTLETWVGAGSGYIRTWFNQSISLNHDLIQTTNSNQPIIVDSGVLVTQNSKPSIKFTGSQFLGAGTVSHWAFLHSAKSSVFTVHRIEGANPDTLYAIWATGSSVSATRSAHLRYDDRSVNGFNDDWFHVLGNNGIVSQNQNFGQNEFATNKLITSRVHGDPLNATVANRSYVGVDSNSLVNVNTAAVSASVANPTHALRIGEANGNWRLVGNISEVIIYTGNLTPNNAQAFDLDIDAEMKSYYGIT